MRFNIFTIQPAIFDSFLTNSLIARGIAQDIIDINRINWRDQFGVGGYKQIDDKPFGGGSGMVLQPDPIYNALLDQNMISQLYKKHENITPHSKTIPNNSKFFNLWQQNPQSTKKVTISLTPRGFPINQQIVEWVAGNFDEVGILCGRYEGFDHRVNELVDLELSLGDFVLNGGEVAAMALIEATSRLLPGFVTKSENVMHDSFSSELNYYREQEEYSIGKKKILSEKTQQVTVKPKTLFEDNLWLKNILPYIEHPQYSRPEIWENMQVPEVLLSGNHKDIQAWRLNWWK
jgi:tRNA (guanine37-N1)-methyltransferase